MKKYYPKNSQKCLLLIIFIVINFSRLFAQTQPVPQNLPFFQNFDIFSGSATNYPSGFQGWVVASSAPITAGRTDDPIGDRFLAPNGSATTGVVGIYDFNGKIGLLSSNSNDLGLALALNTTTVSSLSKVKVSFDAMVIRNLYNAGSNNIINSLVLQYRLGSTGKFTNVNNCARNGLTNQSTGTNGLDIKNVSFLLPSECSNQPNLQLRWILRLVSGSLGDRPSFAIDNISVESEAPTAPAPFNGYVISTKNIKISNGTTYSTNVLSGVTRVEKLSKYGGSLADYIGNPKGYFTTYKDERDTWYLLDPEGYKFFSLGVNSLVVDGGVDPVNQIKSIYANTIGNFSDETLTSMPYCLRLTLGFAYRATSTRLANLYNGGILAVFDPDFGTFSNQRAADLITPERLNDKNLLGYFSDNEMPLGNSIQSDKLIDRWLNVNNYGGQSQANNDINYITAVNWIKSRHGGNLVTPTTADKNEWPGVVADRYFKVCSEAIKSVDNNHLYLGSRINADLENQYLFTSAGKYVDVLSCNNYSAWDTVRLNARYNTWEKYAKKPFLIGEFYAQAEDSGLANASGAGFKVKTQQDRADFFEHYTMEILKRKYGIGFQYFKYNDSPANNTGLLDNDFQWWEPVKASYTKIAQDVYRLREYLLYGEQSLPVTLTSFTAKANLNKVELKWFTQAEPGNKKFVIQRSADGKVFTTLSEVATRGNLSVGADYITYDDSPFGGINYYRLIQYDMDGKSRELGIRTVNFQLNNGRLVVVYPNPTQNFVNVSLNCDKEEVINISLVNINGKVLQSKKVRSNSGLFTYKFEFNGKLEDGIYIVHLNGDGINTEKKISVLNK